MEMDAGQSEPRPVPAVFTKSPWDRLPLVIFYFSLTSPASPTAPRTCVSWCTGNREPAHLPQRVVLKLFGLEPIYTHKNY